MFVCMDANFRLKNQLASNYSQDPGLGTGWAYMIARKPYENYVLSRADDHDVSSFFRRFGQEHVLTVCRLAHVSVFRHWRKPISSRRACGTVGSVGVSVGGPK